MIERWRPLVLPVGALLYVGFASALARDNWSGWLALIGIPAFLVLSWRRTAPPARGEDHVDPVARQALRAVLWGGCLWAIARTGPAGRPGLDAAANLGVATAAVAALVGLARISPIGGLLAPPPSTRSLDAAGLVTLLWGIAIALPVARALAPGAASQLDPIASDYATATAGIGSLLVLVAAAWRVRVLRRLELGVADRAAGALALSLTAFLVAVPATLLDIAPPDRVLPISLILAALATAWTTTTPEPTSVSSGLRGVLAVTVLGAPLALLAGVAARQAPLYAGPIVLASCALSVAVGLVARAVARPLGPEQSRWLTAIQSATEDALQPEPTVALQRALAALSKTSSTPGNRPELWQIEPPEVLSVDVAGYLHSTRAEAPASLYELASAEPERTLRAETLRVLQVRRPEVRPLLDWFESRSAFSATLIAEQDGPTGLILLPRGNRTSPMSLEEARAVRNLADRISSLMAVASALSRSRQSALEARAALELARSEKHELELVLQAEGAANRRHAELVAEPLVGSGYSPASRMLLEELIRLGKRSSDERPNALLVEHPHGIDPAPWAARLHLGGPKGDGRLVMIDAAQSRYHSSLAWEGPESPFVLAHGGTLVVRDAAALPEEIQELLALAPRAGGFSLVLTRREQATAGEPDQPSSSSTDHPPDHHGPGAALGLAPRLERLVASARVRIPSLAERAEDLRPMVLERLAREGLRQRGEALGAEPRVIALLIEHSWPGNERELDTLVQRLVERASSSLVTAADLAALDFRPDSLNVASYRGEFMTGRRGEFTTSKVSASSSSGAGGVASVLTPLPLPTRRRPGPRRRR